MNEIGRFILASWIAMYLAVIIAYTFNIDIDLVRAFVVGNIVFGMTIVYMVYGWYVEDKSI